MVYNGNWIFHGIYVLSAAKSHETKKTTGKQQCNDCGRWFVNLSCHRMCNGRSLTTPHADVLDAPQADDNSRNRRTSRSGTSRKDALKQKILQPKDKALQVSDILIAVTIVVTRKWTIANPMVTWPMTSRNHERRRSYRLPYRLLGLIISTTAAIAAYTDFVAMELANIYLWVKYSCDRRRHVALKKSTRDPNMLTAECLENGWR